MEITINTDKVTSGGTRLTKSLLLAVFSAGWLYPLAGVILIPAGLVQEHLEQTRLQIAAVKPAATASEANPGAALSASVSDTHEAESRDSPAAKQNQIDRQLHAIGELRICAVVFCIWLAMVIAYWSWTSNRLRSVRS